MRKPALLFILATMAVSAPLAAKDKPATPSPLVHALEGCRAIADPAARLACFDKTSGELIAATQSGDVSVVDRAQMRQARRGLFGWATPKLPFFEGDKSADDDKGELDTTIVSARAIGMDRYRIKIAEGDAVWETTETYLNFTPPKAGQTILIKRGPLGSYFLKIDNQKGVKGKRVE